MVCDKIDFEKETPFYENGVTKWYISKHFQDIIENKQAFNLPKLQGFGCFIVKGKGVSDLVLIDSKQNILGSYHFNSNGYEQMQAKINIIKISKYYDECERANV